LKIDYATVSLCEIIARDAHKDQKRSDGKDYITHPRDVAKSLTGYDLQCIAWLHDVLEDNLNFTPQVLANRGVPRSIIENVLALTRFKDSRETYLEYLLNLKKFPEARIVKMADIQHNLRDLKSGNLRDKYLLALYILEQA
jgi:(p)ppGpp synthase/HD superfamily hydrolase